MCKPLTHLFNTIILKRALRVDNVKRNFKFIKCDSLRIDIRIYLLNVVSLLMSMQINLLDKYLFVGSYTHN